MKIISIRCHSGDKGRDGKRVHLGTGKIGNLVKQVIAERLKRVPGDSRSDPVGPHVAYKHKGCAHHHHAAPEKYAPDIILWCYLINNIGQDIRNQQIHDRARELDREAVKHGRDMRFQIMQEIFHEDASSFPGTFSAYGLDGSIFVRLSSDTCSCPALSPETFSFPAFEARRGWQDASDV